MGEDVDMPPTPPATWPKKVAIIIAIGLGGFMVFTGAPWWMVTIAVLSSYFGFKYVLVGFAESLEEWF